MSTQISQITLKILIPTQILYEEAVDMVVLPGKSGEFGVLVGHVPFIANLKAGTIKIYIQNTLIQQFEVNGGLVQITDNICTVMTEQCIPDHS